MKVRNKYHKFARRPIPDGDKFVLETCMICGVERRRFWDENSKYMQHDGIWRPMIPECRVIDREAEGRLDGFIRANHEFLTIDDIAYETGWNLREVARACARLGLTPISAEEQRKRYLLDNHKHKTLEELSKAMNYPKRLTKQLLIELGLIPYCHYPHVTISQIFADYKVGDEYGLTEREFIDASRAILRSKKISDGSRNEPRGKQHQR